MLDDDGFYRTGDIFAETAPATKQKMLAATSRDTVRSAGRTGKPARQLVSDWTDAWAPNDGGRKPLPLPLQNMLSEPVIRRIDRLAGQGHPGAQQLATYFVGQVVGSMNTVKPTKRVVLEMIEAGVPFRDFSLDNPIRAIREVSHDLTGRRPVRLAGGRQASALDIQREYYARAVEYLQTREPNSQIEQVVDLWGRQLDAVESQDFAKVDTEIDWVIKRKLFQRYQDRYSMELSDPKISQLDLAYHDIKRGRGVFDLLQRKGLATRVTTDEEIEAAVDTPPQTTRAKLRGEFISAAQEAGRDFTVDWVHLKLNDQAQRTVLCKDPFRSVDERVKRLIASM